MITITSNTQSEQEMQDVYEQRGLTVVKDEPETKPDESAQPGKPGEQPAAPASETTAPVTEPEEKPQEPQATPAKHGKPNFKSKLERAEENLAHVREELENERGDKSKLLQKIEELEAKVNDLSAKPVEEAPKTEEPVRPKRPKRADFDFDDDEKFEEALAKYDEDMLAYNDAVSESKVKKALEADRQERQKEEQQRVEDKRQREYNERLTQGIAEIPDYAETIKELGESPVPLPPVMEAYIAKSKVPALLVYSLAKDVLENEAKYLEQLAELDPIDMVAELRDFERKVVAEHNKGKEKPVETKPVEAKPDPVAEEKKPEPAPAKPKPVQKVEPPIEPVGSRAATSNPSLGNATSLRDYIIMRRQGVSR